MLVFAYGSLIYRPELPDALIECRPGYLAGQSRAFNKRSRTRCCAQSETYNAFPDVAPQFLVNGIYQSLVLGTESKPDDRLEGVIQRYHPSAANQLREHLDQREGYDARREDHLNGYIRCEQEVFDVTGASVGQAVVYLTNPNPKCQYRVTSELTLAQRAQILINATPKNPSADEGLLYLEGVRHALARHKIVDPYLEALTREVLSFDGPWHSIFDTQFNATRT